jgi:hypothetical protein
VPIRKESVIVIIRRKDGAQQTGSFTGWEGDTGIGWQVVEARAAGRLKVHGFEFVWCTRVGLSCETSLHVMDELDYGCRRRHWRLNERCFEELTGLSANGETRGDGLMLGEVSIRLLSCIKISRGLSCVVGIKIYLSDVPFLCGRRFGYRKRKVFVTSIPKSESLKVAWIEPFPFTRNASFQKLDQEASSYLFLAARTPFEVF